MTSSIKRNGMQPSGMEVKGPVCNFLAGTFHGQHVPVPVFYRNRRQDVAALRAIAKNVSLAYTQALMS